MLSTICPSSGCYHPSDKKFAMCSLQETSAASGKCGIPPPFLNELEELYGDPNRSTGCFMSTGSIGAATPPHFGPSSDHSGSKRDNRDNVINSPEKKKSCNVGEYMACLSESIAVRSTSRDRERTHEQVEVDEAMQILREDGVPGTLDHR